MARSEMAADDPGAGRSRAVMLAAVAAIAALAVVVSVVSSGSTEPTAQDSLADQAVAAPDAAPATETTTDPETAEPAPTPPQTPRPRTFPTALPEPAVSLDSSPTGGPPSGSTEIRSPDALANHDVGTGYVGSGFAVYNLETGERMATQRTPAGGFSNFMVGVSRSGTVSSTEPFAVLSGEDGFVGLAPWGGGDPILVEVTDESWIWRVIDDPEAGPLALVGPPFDQGLGEREAVSFGTGERRPVLLDPVLAQLALPFLSYRSTLTARAWVSASAGDAVYRWTWADGWQRVAAGTVLRQLDDLDLVQQCADPTSCRFVFIDAAGAEVGWLDVAPALGLGDISADHSRWASLPLNDFNSQNILSALSVIDVKTGEAQNVTASMDFHNASRLQWMGDTHVLVTSDRPMIVNVETGEQFVLTFLGQDNGAGFFHLPEIAE